MKFVGGLVGAYGAHGASAAVGRGIKEGTRTVDIGEASLGLKQIGRNRSLWTEQQGEEQRKLVDQQIREIGQDQAKREGGGMFNRGQISSQYSEMLGVVKIGAAKDMPDFKNRADAAKFLADQNLELARTFVALGMDQEKATETSIKFGKALEMQGRIFDASGKIDIGAASAQYDDIRKLIPAIGKEATGENYLALMKYLRTSKFSLSPEAMASAMFKFEEMGTGAAVGINQMIKNISGGAKPAQLGELARLWCSPDRQQWQEAKGRPTQRSRCRSAPQESADLR